MKRAFTLVELLVVIGIIGILSAIMLGTFAGSNEAGRAARCLTNLKNLAAATQSYAMEHSYYPYAAPEEYSFVDVSKGIKNAKLKYYEHPGWVNWYSKDIYPAQSSQKGSCKVVSMYSDNVEEYEYALQKGGLFKSIGGNVSSYVCPEHEKVSHGVHWSYLMNPNISARKYGEKIRIANTKRDVSADRVLLFSEIPFRSGCPSDWTPDENNAEETDAVLQYEDKERIGANHISGKRWVAHVVFADAHVEKLAIFADGGDGSSSNLKDLTKWLCEGEDVSLNGTVWEKLD